MTLVPPYELGQIACCASEVSGKTVTNPYPEGTIAWKLWERGYTDEAARILKEREAKEADS